MYEVVELVHGRKDNRDNVFQAQIFNDRSFLEGSLRYILQICLEKVWGKGNVGLTSKSNLYKRRTT